MYKQMSSSEEQKESTTLGLSGSRTNRRMDRLMDSQIEEHAVWQTDGWTNKQTDDHIDRRADEQMTDIWMDRLKDG
jgi:hypothetical protein